MGEMNKRKIKIPDLKSAYVEVVSIEEMVEVERLVYRVLGIVGPLIFTRAFTLVRTNFVHLISRASATQCEHAKRAIQRWWVDRLSDD